MAEAQGLLTRAGQPRWQRDLAREGLHRDWLRSSRWRRRRPPYQNEYPRLGAVLQAHDPKEQSGDQRWQSRWMCPLSPWRNQSWWGRTWGCCLTPRQAPHWGAQCRRRKSDRRSNQLDQRRFVHCFGVFVNRFQNTLSQVLADLSFVLLSPAPLFPTFVSMTNLGIHQICPQICPQKDREPICFLMTAYE